MTGPTRSRNIHPESFTFTVLIGALTALPSLATDMSLPALDGIARALHASPGEAALTLSLFLVGYALAPIAFGPLSDEYGRRPVVIAGCALFALAAILGTFAGSIPMLLLWRLLQGAGAGAGTVISFAVVRDLFDGAGLRRRLAQISIVRVIAPMVGPSLGAFVLPFGGWRGIYALTALLATLLLAAAILRLAESAPRFSGRPHVPVRLITAYARVLRNRACLGYSLVNACAFGCLFGYINGSSLVMIGVLGVSPRLFGLLFALVDMGLLAGFFLNGRLNAWGIGRHAPLLAGLWLSAAASLALLALSLAGMTRLPGLVSLLLLAAFGYGLVTPNATQGALQPLPEVAGVAAAVLSLLMMLTGAFSGMIVSALFDGRTALAMTGVMAAFSAGALALYLAFVRPAERAR
ncbi:MAG TPA: multidrug effflux MFS transporter [Acetobacteraceae bacterium]|jgi:MFS transporter, DHA1 family, multidrug resistance protein|nr:multidrug effflux MFS transporter [Acetobacteraceae bacterium]